MRQRGDGSGGTADTERVGSASGGCIFNDIAAATIVNSTLAYNQAIGGSGNSPGTGATVLVGVAQGGGILASNGANLVVRDSTLTFNQAIGGDTTSVSALNGMADQIHAVMAKYNYQTGKLPDLK